MKQTTWTPSLSRLLAAVFIIASCTLILTGARAAASGHVSQSGAAGEAQKYLPPVGGQDSLMAAVKAAEFGDGARIMQLQQARLLANDAAAGDKFGYSVAISGNTAVVGAYLHGTGSVALRLGAVYVFQRTSSVWNRQATLLPGDLMGTYNFGYSVAISGDTIVVGALGNNVGSSGQVYIFQRTGTTWSERQRIQGTSRTFGTSVALDGTILLVGEPGAITRSQTGAVNAYLFNGSTWDFEAQFVGNDATTADAFGISVSISGNTALVGAYGDDTNIGFDAGSAYIFVRNGTIWNEQAHFFATDPGVGNLYGWSVSLSGNVAAVGSYNDDLPGKANTGAVYVYERTGTTWSAQQKLVANDAKADDKLGYSVAINGNIIVAGAYFYDLPTTQNVGAAYIFQRIGTVWFSGGMATPEEPQPGDLFGSSVALSDTTFLAGAPNADIPTNLNIGTSHVYSLRPSTRFVANFDGDTLTDLSVFRPSDNSWYARQSSNGLPFIQQFGASGDSPAPGDYDGDGRTDVAVFRPSNGTWYILYSSNGVFRARQFGMSGDLPVPGDYDGNGITDIALFRPSDNTWYIFVGSTNSLLVQQFGASGDRPVQSDYDGDCKTDIAVFRPANGTWYMIQSLTNSFRAQPWGASGDMVAPGDYDGDTRTDIAVFRPVEGNWYILNSAHNTSRIQPWGTSGDVAVPGDYNGDGKSDVAIFRPVDGNWYILESGLNTLRVEQWGASGDVPVPTAHLP